MSESKHTPGPWKWWTTHEGSHRINPEEGGLVIASCDTRNPFSYEQEANARLIAAAPDLLEALKDLLDTSVWADAEGNVTIRLSGEPAVKRAIAAIAKAEGRDA